jgi:hypothetical protein
LKTLGGEDVPHSVWELQAKLNTHLAYALDGQRESDYPDLARKPFRIQLDTTTEPPEDVLQMTRRMREACKQYGVVFVLNVLTSP